MASRARDVLEALRDAIQRANGESPYTNNLSGTGVVTIGGGTQTPNRLGVYIHDISIGTTEETSLGSWRRYIEVTVTGFTGAKQGTSEARLLAATDLFDDICRGIETNRGLPLDGTSKVLDVAVRGAAFTRPDESAEGDVVATVTAYWHTTTGA